MNLYHTQSTRQFVEGSTPTTPPSGVVTLFASASALNILDSGGNVVAIGGGGGGGVTVSATAPTSPSDGDLWFNSDTGSLYVWYVDADGGQWVLPDLNTSSSTTVSLSSQVSDILPVANGGTGVSSLSTVNLSSFGSGQAVDGYVATADGGGGVVWEEAALGLTHFTESRADTGINSTVPVVSLSATGAETNIDAAIVPKGTGALIAAIPDGAVAGGNKRGAYAVDLQMYRAAANQVASNNYAVAIGARCQSNGQSGSVAIGYNASIASGLNYYSVAIGSSISANESGAVVIGCEGSSAGGSATAIGVNSSANQYCSVALGRSVTTDLRSFLCFSGGAWSVQGDRKTALGFGSIKTTDATPTEIKLQTIFGDTRIGVSSGFFYDLFIIVSGIKSDGSDCARYSRRVGIKNVAGTTSLVGTVEAIGTDHEDNSSTDIAITADDTNDSLKIEVTGIAAETWRWCASIYGSLFKYGT